MAYSDLNVVTLIGRLTADPKQDTLPSGKTKTTFSIANNYYNPNNDNAVNFFNLVAFGKLAETCATYLKKGKQIAVHGTLRQGRWKDKNGNNRSSVDVIISDMQMLGSKNESGYQQQDTGGAYERNASQTQSPSSSLSPSGDDFEDDEIPF